MNLFRAGTSLFLLTALASVSHAQTAKTREQVIAERLEAVRTGDVYAIGDSGLKLNELYPQRYPKAPAPVARSREEVKAELAEARRSGDLVVAGESGLTLREQFPQRYPAAVEVAITKTREQVKAETLQAIRNGDIYPAGEGNVTLHQAYPQRYATARAAPAPAVAAAPGASKALP